MSKIGNYLQEHLNGELIENSEVRKYFSMDNSPIQIVPNFVAFPADERDIRKINRFCYQMAQRGRYVPIAARGFGSSANGSSLSTGLIMSTTNHLNKLVAIENKSGVVVVEAGISIKDLNNILIQRGLNISLPEAESNMTLGGLISSNLGNISNYIKSLKIVLSNGEVLTTELLSEKELSKKMGQLNFEGEIYRAVDAILEEKPDLNELAKNLYNSSAGYALNKIKSKQGFDLTPLFIGAEGTLGIIHQVTLKTESIKIEDERYLLASFENSQDLEKGLNLISNLSIQPSSVEYLSEGIFNMVDSISPNLLKVMNRPYSKNYLILGFSGAVKNVDKGIIKALKHLSESASNLIVVDDLESEISLKNKLDNINKILFNHYDKGQRVLKVLEGVGVPVENNIDLLNGIDVISRKLNIKIATYGSIHKGKLSVLAKCDLSEIGDRQSYFKLINDIGDLAVSLGGSIASEGGVGRTLTPFMKKEFSLSTINIFKRIKDIFDPMYILNPNVKFDTDDSQLKKLLTNNFTPRNLEY